MATNVEEIIDYYVDLLIVQYHDKPRARATVGAVIREMVVDGVQFDVLNGYELDTAVGTQLDILAEYIGVDRFFTRQILEGYFSFYEYTDTDYEYSGKIGFSTYDDFDTKEGSWLTYAGVISQQITLSDEEFRTILKLKIVQNNSNHSHKSIDDSMYAFFGNTVVPFSGGDMEMTYLISGELTPIIEVAIQKEVLPRPMAVGLTILNSFPGLFLVEGSSTLSPVVEFTRATVGTYIDAVGGLGTDAIDAPRFTYSQ